MIEPLTGLLGTSIQFTQSLRDITKTILEYSYRGCRLMLYSSERELQAIQRRAQSRSGIRTKLLALRNEMITPTSLSQNEELLHNLASSFPVL